MGGEFERRFRGKEEKRGRYGNPDEKKKKKSDRGLEQGDTAFIPLTGCEDRFGKRDAKVKEIWEGGVVKNMGKRESASCVFTWDSQMIKILRARKMKK